MSVASSFLYVPSPYTALLAAAKQKSRKKTKRETAATETEELIREKQKDRKRHRKIKDIQRPIFKKERKGMEIDSEAGESEKDTPIKKKIKFSSYIRKFRMEQLQSHI